MRRESPLASTWTICDDPGFVGHLWSAFYAPAERARAQYSTRERTCEYRVNEDVDHASFTRRRTAVHTMLTELCLHPIALNRRVI